MGEKCFIEEVRHRFTLSELQVNDTTVARILNDNGKYYVNLRSINNHIVTFNSLNQKLDHPIILLMSSMKIMT